jgi:hypothetical protein
MVQELSMREIEDIERHVEEIDAALDILDPSNPIEAQEIERKARLLQSYVALLEPKKAPVHLRLV